MEVKNYRQNRLIRIPLLATGLILSPKTVFGESFVNAKNVVYENLPEFDVSLLKRAVDEDYPNSFVHYYRIQQNERGFSGGFRFERNQDGVSLEIRVVHELENKLMIFSERRRQDTTFYSEYVYNFNEERLEYNHPNIIVKKNTFPRLINSFFDKENIDGANFIFFGSNEENNSRNYKITSTSYKNTDGNLVCLAKLKGNNLKVKKVEGLFYNVDEKLLLVALDVDYEIRKSFFGFSTYPDVTFRGVLTESLDKSLFEKPK